MSLSRALVDIITNLGIKIDARMTLPPNWVGEDVETDQFVALVYVVDGEEDQKTADDQFRVDLFGPGIDATMTKAEELKDLLVWDAFGSSFHFHPHGMIDDVTVATRPHPVDASFDRVALASTTYSVTSRD